MKYYAERHKKLNEDFEIWFDDLKNYFLQIYRYFERKNCFEAAYKGIHIIEKYTNEEQQVLSSTMAPSPQIFFINHMRKDTIYPIWEHYEGYSESELFTVIEILYDHIGIYDYNKDQLVKEDSRVEYAEFINNILKFYKEGFMLDKANGIIMEIPNQALQALLQTEFPEDMPEDVIDKLRTASKMYFRFDSNEEAKKKAINILADILEPIRENLKNLFNEELGVNKNNHDKLLFDIVNNFNIRHNNPKQVSGYNKSIWYDWMMQYYTSVILTYYRLLKERDKIS